MFQINGKLTNKISIEDRAVQFGDGVFETIAVKENLLEFLHLKVQLPLSFRLEIIDIFFLKLLMMHIMIVKIHLHQPIHRHII